MNIQGVRSLVESETNKHPDGNNTPEGVTGDKFDVLDLPMSDEELLSIRNEYEKVYGPYEAKIRV